MRTGFTLPELVIVLVVIGLVLGVAAPKTTQWRDQRAVNRAVNETVLFYERVRFVAVIRSRTFQIEFGPEGYSAVSELPGTPVRFSARGPVRRGVALTVSRSVIRLSPNGLGYGAANTKLVFRRGSAAESLTVSRLGRLKRWK